jgi:NTE family protein
MSTMQNALVLCGGGSLGSYEIGAWKYLREKGMSFQIVTGTSIGAINGAMVATNDFDKAVDLWSSIAADQVMVNGVNFYNGFFKDGLSEASKKFFPFAKTYLKNGGADISPLVKLVHETIDPEKVKNSLVKLGIVTTTYPGLKETDVLLNDVPQELILDYLHASSACYPIFPPYKVKGKSYIDGGYHNNLPIDFALRLGAESIVAVLLHAVPKMPQHPEMMSLPFVTTIRPSRDTGSIMDFYGKTTHNNMILGYNDAMKTFGDAWGRAFTFKPDDSYLPLAEEFTLALGRRHPYDFKKVTEALTYEFIEPKTPKQIFIRTLELLGDWLELDYLPIYSIPEYLTLVKDKLAELSRDNKMMAFVKTHKWGHSIRSDERKNYLLYLYYLTVNHLKSNKMTALYQFSPEAAALAELFIALNSKGWLVNL